MQISDRQKTILDTIIREYVDSAKPVSSQYLGERYDFGICPASIRIEMQKLTDDGFLTQPHTSAGRVPTDKGYRLFVNEVLKSDQEQAPSGKLDFGFDGFDKDFEDFFKTANSIAHSLAAASSLLVLGYLRQEDLIFKKGWEDVLRQPEFAQKGLMDNFLDYLDYLEANIETMKPAEALEIFIGDENPCPKAKELSVFSMVFEPASDRELVLSLVGPKRTAYDKNIGLINEAVRMFENI